MNELTLRQILRDTLLLLAALCMSGCATTETRSFNAKKDAQVESAHIATGADFSQYDSLLALDAGIYFPESAPTTGADMERIRRIFREAFLTELDGYTVTEEPGPRTMAVQPTLIDLRASGGAEALEMRPDLRDMARPGSLVFLMELKDSQSGEVLARAGDSAQAPAFATAAGTETDWPGVERAARHWAALFREFLDQNLGSRNPE
jgi:hypothetical protein